MRLLVKVLNQRRIDIGNRLTASRFGRRLATTPHSKLARVSCRCPSTYRSPRTRTIASYARQKCLIDKAALPALPIVDHQGSGTKVLSSTRHRRLDCVGNRASCCIEELLLKPRGRRSTAGDI